MKQALNTLDLQEHDDVSRETFASDTNEALESLEEVPEDIVEPAVGIEETPVVYNSNDLEVFWCNWTVCIGVHLVGQTQTVALLLQTNTTEKNGRHWPNWCTAPQHSSRVPLAHEHDSLRKH